MGTQHTMKTTKQLFGIVILTVGVLFQIQAQDPFTNGLVAYYPFNGNANDASGNGNHGQLTAGTSFVSDKFGNVQGALENTNVITPGTVAGVLTPNVQNPGNFFSLFAWFKATPQMDGQLISFGDGQNGHDFNADRNLIFSGGKISFYVYPGYQAVLTATNIVTYDRWHSAVATLSGAGMRLYLDGVMVTNNPSVTTAQSYNGYWHMARTLGDIDDARIYNRALSDSEIQQLYIYESQTHDAGAFQIVYGQYSWPEAKADAESRGGHLATFRNQAEWNLAQPLISQINSEIIMNLWIGGYQPVASPEPAGGWSWVTGEPWNFSLWLPGEPNQNQGINEDALIVAGLGGTGWNDAPSSGKTSYVLEIEPQVRLIKAVKPSFSKLEINTNYQLQLSGDMSIWTNQGSAFTATNTSMVYPQYWDVENWGSLFFRLQVLP